MLSTIECVYALRMILNTKTDYFLKITNTRRSLYWKSLFSVREGLNIPDYYKRNRHFQCCIETKLLMN